MDTMCLKDAARALGVRATAERLAGLGLAPVAACHQPGRVYRAYSKVDVAALVNARRQQTLPLSDGSGDLREEVRQLRLQVRRLAADVQALAVVRES